MMIPDNNIDSLFNDLKDLEVSPSDKVWKGIENRLEKKKKRIIPLYWRIGAAASVLLAIGFFLFNSGEPNDSDNQFVRQSSPAEREISEKPAIAQSKTGAEKRQNKTDDDTSGFTTKVTEEISNVADEENKSESSKPINATKRNLSTTGSTIHLTKFEETGEKDQPDEFYEKMVAHTHKSGRWMSIDGPDTKKLAETRKEKIYYPANKSTESLSDIENSKPSVRFILGGEYSPTYAFRETSGGSASNNSESGINKAGGGISLAVKVNSRWQIETGVKYAMLGQEVRTISRSDRVYSFAPNASEKSMDITRVNLSNSLGSVNPNISPSRMQDAEGFLGSSNELVELQSSDYAISKNPLLEQNLGYLQVPFTVRYQLLEQSRVSLSLSGGFSTNWLVDNNAYLEMSGERKRIGQTQGLADMGLSTHAGVAVALPVFRGIHLRMEPRIDYFISDVSKDAPGTFRPYSFGVFTGLFYEW